MMKDDLYVGSGNVFADLGLENPDEMLVKVELLRQITYSINRKGLSVIETASLLAIHSNDVLTLLRGNTRPYSEVDLQQFLNILEKGDN